LIRRLQRGDTTEISPTADAAAAFNAAIRDQLPETIWATGCKSWYIDQRGQVASWPWTFDKFVDDLRAPRWDDFELR
jgi:cyclohexanone monooxygenase